MNHFDGEDFSEFYSEEVMFLLTLSVEKRMKKHVEDLTFKYFTVNSA